MLGGCRIGPIPPSIGWCGLAPTLRIGQGTLQATATTSVRGDGFRCAQPILRAAWSAWGRRDAGRSINKRPPGYRFARPGYDAADWAGGSAGDRDDFGER